MQALAQSARDLSDIADADTRFTRFRGDGWQLVLGRPGWALRACLILLADLRASGAGIETRISVGIGRHDSLGTKDLSDASGPAFFVAGENLERISKYRRLMLAETQTKDETGKNLRKAIFDLVDGQTSQWTKAQAEAVAIWLRQGQMTDARHEPTTQKDIAKQIGITRQAAQTRLAGAKSWTFESALTCFEHLDWEATS
ncbi:hypothetical protein [Neogemmobacter tilapiae]|nr:hypothetical protein [Gemmobacter tilapiae]